MKRGAPAAEASASKKPATASDTAAFPRGAAPRAPKPAASAARRPDDTLFKSGAEKAKGASAAGDGPRKETKFRGKAAKPTTATRMKRKRSEDAVKRQGGVQEDLDSNWAEGGMRIPKFVEPLRFRKVNTGMLLLGVIKEVREAEALVSLPNNLTGWVEVDEVSDELSELIETSLDDDDAEPPALEDYLHVGMPVRCAVLSTAVVSGKQSGHHKNITVSLKPSRVNAGLSYSSVHVGMALYGAVASVEEHGYTVSLGTEELSAFLPLSEVSGQSSAFPSGVRAGQLVECVVKKLQSGKKLAILTADQSMLTGSVTKEIEESSIDSLQPGMLVNAGVQKVMESGLILRFLSSFMGTVDLSHLPARAALPKVESVDGAVPSPTSMFREKTKVQARILYVDVGAKTVGLSLRQHVVARAPPTYHTQQIKMGQRFDNALVIRVDAGVGMMLRLAGEEAVADDDEDTIKAKSKTVLEGWVHISNVADDKIDKLEKHYSAGKSRVSCRVTGFSWIDGLVTLTMKPSALATDIMVYEDVEAGAKISAKVVKVTEKGCIVSVSEGVRGLIPPGHYADTALKNPEKLLVPGKMLKLRVLRVHAPTHKLILTNKKTLVNSQLPILSSIDDVVEGTVAHGHVAKVQDNGIVVAFYGAVKGFVMLSELGIDRDSEVPSQVFRVNEIVKARITAVDVEEKRIKVSLRTSAADIAAAAAASREGKKGKAGAHNSITLLIGDIVDVEVTNKDEEGVHVKAVDTGAIGYIPASHLSDYDALCAQLMEAIPTAGSEGSVAFRMSALVVEHERSRSRYLLSMKRSLVTAAKEEELPSNLSELQPQQFVQGFVKNVTDFGCFVAFLNGLTALAPKNSLADCFVSSPADYYTVGQSVRCCVVSIDAQAGRAIVTLKPSVCMCPDASLLHSLKESEELLMRARAAAPNAEEGPPEPSFTVGSVVKAMAEEKKSYGMLFAMKDGWTGFCPTKLLDKDVNQGKSYKVAVLGIDRVRDLITVSMDPTTVSALGKTAAMCKAVAKVKISESVKAVVQAVGEERVLLTLPDYGGVVAVASAVDYNLRGQHSTARFKIGQQLKTVVVDNVDGCVLVSCGWELGEKSQGRSSADKTSEGSMGKELTEVFRKLGGGLESEDQVIPGACVKAVVTGLLPSFLAVRLGPRVAGHVAITDVVNAEAMSTLKSTPLADFSKWQVLDARVLGISTSGKKRGKDPDRFFDLSVRPEDLALKKGAVPKARPTLETLAEGDVVPGVIDEVRKDCLWVHLSSTVKGRVYMLDTSLDLDVVKDLPANFKAGQGVMARVLKVDKENARLDLSLRCATCAKAVATPSKKAKLAKGKTATSDLEVGNVVPVKIVKVIPGFAYMVQLSSSIAGRVSICDVSDSSLQEPLSVHKPGDVVHGRIESMETDNIFVSIRPSCTGLRSQLGSNAGNTATAGNSDEAEDDAEAMPQVRSLADLSSGQLVSGYVKSTNAAGCFVQLGRSVTARVLISELSDSFIKDVKGAFPAGKLVTGRILDIDNKKEQISMSLKRTVVLAKKRVLFADVEVGHIIRGTVKSVQSFGVFVRLRNSDLSGLCHISEVSEEFVKDLSKQYAVGDAVKAKVLRKDETKKTISLGMKDTYFEGEEDEEDSDDEDSGDETAGSAMRGPRGEQEEEDDEEDMDESEGEEESAEDEESGVEEESDDDESESENQMEVEASSKKSTAVVDDSEEDEDEDEETKDGSVAANLAVSKGVAFEWDDFGYGKTVEHDDSESEEEEEEEMVEGDTSKSKEKRRKKKEKERQEQVIKDKEAKLLDANAAPETAEEFERLVMSSPNSSYIWIKYMAFHLELTEIDKAREVSERALKTINFREEQERFNVWVALLNLENLYGSRETVMAKFEAACKVNDVKKIHLQLLSIFEKNGEAQITEQFFKTLTRKFRQSCKVWLRYCQFKLGGQHPEAGQRVLDKGLEAIPKRKHVKLISKFALMEYKTGSAERGRTLMEGVVSSYPKRIDLWSVFIEMENKAGNIEGARRLCERAVTLRLRAKQAKMFFKRWLALETASGTPDRVEAVKERARKWVEDNAST